MSGDASSAGDVTTISDMIMMMEIPEENGRFSMVIPEVTLTENDSHIRVEIDGDTAREAERYEMGARIREVEQGPEGNLWVLEDRDGGRLLKLTPLNP